MAQYETTGGDIILTIPNCTCGLTGGCEKCQPIVIRKQRLIRSLPYPIKQVRIFQYDDRGNLITEL